MGKFIQNTIKDLFAKTVNVRKAAYSVMLASWLQIIAAVVLAILYFMGYMASTTVMVVVLVPIIIIGNALLMRNSWNILSFREEWVEMTQTMKGEAELNTMLRAQRHDFINHLQVVHSLIQLDEQREAAQYIEQVYNDIRQVGEVLRTANPALNALLAAKSNAAKKYDIPMEYHISARVENIALEDWELCKVFSNLLDNAIYAARENGDDIHLNLREDINGTYFSIENAGEIPAEIVEKVFEPGVTSKGDAGTGMGLYIIRETLEQYDGRINVETGDGSTRFYGFIPVGKGNSTDG